MAHLKYDHPHLYRRVRLKAIVHLLFGFILIFFPSQATSVSRTFLIASIGLTVLGVFYLIAGILITIGLFRSTHTYRFVRAGMFFAVIINMIVFASLLPVFFTSRTTAFFMVLYGYFVYNLSFVLRDPGWKAIQIVKNIKAEIVENAKERKKQEE